MKVIVTIIWRQSADYLDKSARTSIFQGFHRSLVEKGRAGNHSHFGHVALLIQYRVNLNLPLNARCGAWAVSDFAHRAVRDRQQN